jgi:hypothetical protein
MKYLHYRWMADLVSRATNARQPGFPALPGITGRSVSRCSVILSAVTCRAPLVFPHIAMLRRFMTFSDERSAGRQVNGKGRANGGKPCYDRYQSLCLWNA